MFLNQRPKGTRTRSLSTLHKIYDVKHWLKEDKRQTYYHNILSLCELDADKKTKHVQKLLDNFIESCQGLPESIYRYYSDVAGVMDHALHRTQVAVKLFQEFVILEDGKWSDEQLLWQFVVISASLLKGIGKLYLDYSIEVHDNNGYFIANYNPIMQSFIQVGQFYHYSFEAEGDKLFRRRLNVLIAKQIMPAAAYNWLSTNKTLFSIWLSLLHEDYEGLESLGAILERADAEAISAYFDEELLRLKAVSHRKRVSAFGDEMDPEYQNMDMGLAFLKWVEASLGKGTLMINKAPLLVVPAGFVMCEEMFKLFVREHPEYKNWLAVKNAFLSLSIHDMDAKKLPQTFIDAETGKAHEGYALLHPGLIVGDKVSVTDNKQISKNEALAHVFAVDAMRMSHKFEVSMLQTLNARGEWQLAEKPQSFLHNAVRGA